MRTTIGLLVGLFGLALVACWKPAAADDRGWTTPRPPGDHRPSWRGFEVEVLVNGRSLGSTDQGGVRTVRAIEGAEYEVRIRNPLPRRVAVALSVDGLNVVDARTTGPWDASKWLVRPYGSLTVSGWQMSRERSRRFVFTRERDSYAERLGRRGETGVVRAVFFRERSPVVIEPRPYLGARRESESATLGRSSADDAGGWSRSDRHGPPWRSPDRAATGLGRNERSEVDVVDMELDRDPVAEVVLHYTFDPPRRPPILEPRPRPLPTPLFCPEPLLER